MSSIKIFLVSFGGLLVLAWLVVSLVSLVKMWRPVSGVRGSAWAFVLTIPVALIGTAFVLVMGFWSLLVCTWYWLLRKPIPTYRPEDFRDDKDVV
jgi:hypothetical protein